MSTLVTEQRLFLDESERFDWPIKYNGKDRMGRVQWVFVTDSPDGKRDVMLAGLLVLLNGEVSEDYRSWFNLHVSKIPEQVRRLFE